MVIFVGGLVSPFFWNSIVQVAVVVPPNQETVHSLSTKIIKIPNDDLNNMSMFAYFKQLALISLLRHIHLAS